MASSQTQPFRLLDLPGEIRNKIYREVLCCFNPRASTGPLKPTGVPTGINQATHSINAALLRTSKQVHREAYDVMVKTNQFVKVTTVDISTDQLLVLTELPVVTMDREVADQFQGYVMAVDMSVISWEGWMDEPVEEDVDWEADFDPDIHTPPTGTGPRFNFMLLGREWDAFCAMIARADAQLKGFTTNVKITITLNTYPAELPDYKAPITDFLTERNQEALLKPFRTHIRSFKNATITGSVSPALATTTSNEVAQPLFTDPQKLLSDLEAAKAEGNHLYPQRSRDANLKWGNAIIEMRRIHGSIDWSALAARGGAPFVSRFAELYFTLILNMSQSLLDIMRDPSLPAKTHIAVGGDLAYNLHDAMEAPHAFMHEGSSWVPGNGLMAKLAYRQAVGYRIMGQETGDEEVGGGVGVAGFDGALVNTQLEQFRPGE